MSSGQTVILSGQRAREQAQRLIARAPDRSVVLVKPPARTTDQNALMWSLLSELSRAKPEGRCLTPDVWKSIFLHAMDHSIRFEMALDGRGMVPVGFRSSRLSKAQMSELIEMIYEYGARCGVEFSEQRRAA